MLEIVLLFIGGISSAAIVCLAPVLRFRGVGLRKWSWLVLIAGVAVFLLLMWLVPGKPRWFFVPGTVTLVLGSALALMLRESLQGIPSIAISVGGLLLAVVAIVFGDRLWYAPSVTAELRHASLYRNQDFLLEYYSFLLQFAVDEEHEQLRQIVDANVEALAPELAGLLTDVELRDDVNTVLQQMDPGLRRRAYYVLTKSMNEFFRTAMQRMQSEFHFPASIIFVTVENRGRGDAVDVVVSISPRAPIVSSSVKCENEFTEQLDATSMKLRLSRLSPGSKVSVFLAVQGDPADSRVVVTFENGRVEGTTTSFTPEEFNEPPGS